MSQKDQGIVHKTSDVLSFYGLSNKGLFYYEEKGLIAPKRTDGGNYRIYTLQETTRLHRCRIFREFGFSVEESVQLTEHCSAEELCGAFSKRTQEIEREIMRDRLYMEELAKNIEIIRRIGEGDVPYERMLRPAMYRMSMRDIEKPYGKKERAAYQLWSDMLPVAAASLMFDWERVDLNEPELPLNLGFIIDCDSAEKMNAVLPEYAYCLEQIPCVYTVICGEDDRLNETQRIRPAAEKIAQMGLRICGNPVTKMLATFDIGQGMQRFDHAWFPVEEK